IGGVRWWNVKHPAAYAGRLAGDRTPAYAREVLEDETRRIEQVLLESRLADGLALNVLDDGGAAAVEGLVADALVEVRGTRLVLTPRGRLLADDVVHRLTPCHDALRAHAPADRLG